jgi:PKD repeat protein
MVPVANFLVSPNLLTIKFTDTSTNTPTTWSWDFGDNTTPSTSQNPTHTYTNPGKYIVKLTSTNPDGNSSLQREIVISTTPILPVSLRTLVNLKIPSSLSVNEELKDGTIAQWQLYIQPLVYPEIPYSLVFDETAYPPLANVLIAYLSAYSILESEAIKSTISDLTSNSSGSTGNIKKITTGPSEVEFQNDSQVAVAIFGKNGDGMISQLVKEICTLSHRLDISLPMCPPLPKQILLSLKATKDTNKIS